MTTRMMFRTGIVCLCFVMLWCCAPNWQWQGYTHQQYRLTTQTSAFDSSLHRMIQPYRDSLEASMHGIVGYTAAPMRDAMHAQDGEARTPEQHALFNFCADACLTVALQDKSANVPRPDFVLFTATGLRNSLPAGPITLEQMFNLMPFENFMVLLEVDESIMTPLLNFLARRPGDPVAGMTMQAQRHLPEEVRIGGQPYQSQKTYYILTYDYLAGGGDGLDMLKRARRVHTYSIKTRDAMIQFLQQNTSAASPWQPVYEERIRKQ